MTKDKTYRESSNLKRDIEKIDVEFLHGVPVKLPPATVTQIINLIESVIPELEKLEKGDPHLEKKISYNQAILDIKSKLIGGSNGTE